MSFKKATREKSKLRLAIDGPTGAGKTLTALRMAMHLARHEAAKFNRAPRVAFVDTEFGTARKYCGDVHDDHPIDFDVDEPSSFSPSVYTAAVFAAAKAGYDVVVLDSLSHAWNGVDGALALVDKKANGGNNFTAWKHVTPLQNQMIESIIRCPIHVIATMRSKMEYVLEINQYGKSVPRKVGMAPIQRQGVEYEFDIMLDIDTEHVATVAKTRCSEIDGKVVVKPGADLMDVIIHWLDHGNDIPQEKLDMSGLVDPSTIAVASGTSSTAPATVSDSDLEARLAAKRAAMQGATSQPAQGTQGTTTVATAGTSTQPVNGATSNASPPSLAENVGQSVSQTASAGPATTAPQTATVTGPTASSAAAMITGPQQDEIRKMMEQLQVPPEGRVMAYQKRGANALVELTEERAADLIHALRGRLSGLDQLPANKPTVPEDPKYANEDQKKLAAASVATAP